MGVKINVANSGIMHIRKKKAERCNVTYKLDGETISMVSSYKYLGCVVDEFLELKDMVEDKAEAGRRALGACFQRCRAEMGEVTVAVFRKLMESLVESTMMYGAEVWGCSRHLESIEQVLSECSLEWAHFTPRRPYCWKSSHYQLCGRQRCTV